MSLSDTSGKIILKRVNPSSGTCSTTGAETTGATGFGASITGGGATATVSGSCEVGAAETTTPPASDKDLSIIFTSATCS